MSVVGEAALSALFEMIFQKLASTKLLKFPSQDQVMNELKKWEKTLLIINAVLKDAEEKQMTNHSIKFWLAELKDLAYDVEDILDEFSTEALCRNLMAEPQASTSKVRRLIPPCCSSLNPCGVQFNVKMWSKIERISVRLQDIIAQKTNLKLKENAGGRSIRVRERLPTTSLVNEAHVYGREGDKEAIIQVLLRGEDGDAELSVIPIHGMGGIGKTTLAQLVYNDEKVTGNFDIKAWACVSEDFDVVRITKTILESVTSKTCDVDDLNLLQIKLKEELSRRKFLLVLDDVWNENYEHWTILCSPFEEGIPGSKIIVTTRNQGVSSVMGTVPSYCLKELSDDACLSVFTQHSLGTRDFSAHPDLKEIGEEILKRCKGLPLVAKTLGGLLRTKVGCNEWEDVLKSKIWEIPEERSGVIPALRLSYHHLPSHLKRCFSYCSILPKDYEFEEKELVLLWMAEGLIPQPDEGKRMEDVGSSYFRDLLSRSLFQQSSKNKSRFLMHELISGLAQWAAGETCFKLEDKLDGNRQRKVLKRARHSAYTASTYDGIEKFKSFYEAKSLRSFLPLTVTEIRFCHLTFEVPRQLLPELQCLRVLSLSGYQIYELPNSIGNLKHLRYLDLSHTPIRSLPESTTSLYNLQTLILEGCSSIKRLLADIGNLINLHHLNNSGASSLEEMPSRIGKLTSLQTLPDFVVGKGSGSGIKELGPLLHLREKFCISRLENVIEVGDAREANLIGKQNIDILSLKWFSEFNDSRNEIAETAVLDMLQPHRKLKELNIMHYGGKTFPTWLGDNWLHNMVVLRLEGCENCTSLPPAGQLPSLKSLVISGMTKVTSVGPEFYGMGYSQPFQSLQTLSFVDMIEWKEWIAHGVDCEEFPCLRELSILSCPKLLGRLPNQLHLLEKLVINECEQLVISVPSLPMLCKLTIQGCRDLEHRNSVDFSSLKFLTISDISELTCLNKGLLQGLTEVEELEIIGCKELPSLWGNELGLLHHLTSLRRLVVESCPQLVSLVAEDEDEQEQQKLHCRIECFELRDCGSLEKLPQALYSFPSLGELHIEDCPRLIFLPESNWPSMLRVIRIRNCRSLESIPKAFMHNSTCLEQLYIHGCDSLMTFTRSQLPPTLKRLEIFGCANLQSLLEEEDSSFSSPGNISNFSSTHYISIRNEDINIRTLLTSLLEFLSIRKCPSLKSISSNVELPPTLKHLEIEHCPKLESLVQSLHNNISLETLLIWECENLTSLPKGLQNLNHLQWITIIGCQSLLSFPDEGLLSTNLRVLQIDWCDKLVSLPKGIHKLNLLQQLVISSCPGILSFPEQGFPTNLTSLWIKDLKICKPLLDWGLHRLTSLQKLSIWGCPGLVSFPEEKKAMMMLPSFLTSLSIWDFPDLECLSSKGFQNLTSLEYLSLCNCPKLTSFPKKGLPSSILRLDIRWCPLLKRQCKRNKGQWWPMIERIPCVYIDDTFIFE